MAIVHVELIGQIGYETDLDPMGRRMVGPIAIIVAIHMLRRVANGVAIDHRCTGIAPLRDSLKAMYVFAIVGALEGVILIVAVYSEQVPTVIEHPQRFNLG
jgi:hypothetical protein